MKTQLAASPILETIQAMPNKPTSETNNIPLHKGLPIFGSTLSFIYDSVNFVEQQKATYGNVYAHNMFYRQTITLCTPEAAQLVLLDSQKNFASSLGWDRLTGLFGGGILLRDFDEHRIHRRPLQAAFKHHVMEAYCEQLNSLIEAQMQDWKQNPPRLLVPAIKSLLLDNAAAVFLGADLGDESEALNRAFVDLLRGVLAVVRKPIPGTAWHASVRGKRFLIDWLNQQYESRLNSDKTDFFTALCQASLDEEHAMSKQDVIDHTLFLLFAAHDTTTSALSNMMSHLTKHDDWQQRLRTECDAYPEEQLSFRDLSQLPDCELVFNEVLRLHPPVFAIPRRAIHGFELEGYQIPANSSVNIQVHLLHHDKDYWTNPYQFDPERFSPERKEHKQHPFLYIPFGGGAHKCLGFRFAEMQTKIALIHMLRHFEFHAKPNRSTEAYAVPIPLPKDNLPVKLRARR